MQATATVYSPMGTDDPVSVTIDSATLIVTLEQGPHKVAIHISDLTSTIRSLNSEIKRFNLTQ